MLRAGFVAFIVLAVCFFVNPWIEIRWQEVAVFSAFFAGAILCLGFSFLFHTVYCHSEQVGYIFGKWVDLCCVCILYSVCCRHACYLILMQVVVHWNIVYPSVHRQHLNTNDFLEIERKYDRDCSPLFCIQQLCPVTTVIGLLNWTVLAGELLLA